MVLIQLRPILPPVAGGQLADLLLELLGQLGLFQPPAPVLTHGGGLIDASGVVQPQPCLLYTSSPREMPEEKINLAAHGLAEILALDEATLLEKFSDRRSNDCLLRYRVDRAAADAVRDFCEENSITGIRINQDLSLIHI